MLRIQILEYLGNNLRSRSFKCLCAVVLAVGSRKYRNKHGGLSDLVGADVYVFGIIEALIHTFSGIICLRTGTSLKDFFQRRFPGFQSLCHRDLHILVFQAGAVCHFTDYCISDRQFSYLSICHFTDDITKSWGEEISLIYVVLDLHAFLISEGHLGYSGGNTVTVQGIGRKDPSGLDIFSEFSILYF